MHILITDGWHFHRRGFASLMRYLKSGKSKVTYHKASKKWLSAHGRYQDREDDLLPYLEILEGCSATELMRFSYKEVSVYESCRSELMSLLLADDKWQRQPLPETDETLFMKILSENRKALLLNMAAAMEWVDYWEHKLATLDISHIVMFSGSYIYTRTLMMLAERRNIRNFVAEHFFTGNEFYLEERYAPIANNSLLKINSYEEREDRVADHARLLSYAWSCLKSKNNRNVKAIAERGMPTTFDNPAPEILLVTQVMNDFSLIETRRTGIASWPVYRSVIDHVMAQTPFNLTIKTHPWERKRTNIMAAKTRAELESYVNSLPPATRARIRLFEKESLDALLKKADWVITLSSQAGLDAVMKGIKPIVLGDPFYGHKGFTFDLRSEESLVGILLDKTQSPILTLEEFSKFEDFVIQAFCSHLYSVKTSSNEEFETLFSKSGKKGKIFKRCLDHAETSSSGKFSAFLKEYLRTYGWKVGSVFLWDLKQRVKSRFK
ncbi:MAG: hypothetical protein MI743_17580 [Sneathiellales bacterium]|nr:hypothetical protein [Sneathiellales bacterium]